MTHAGNSKSGSRKLNLFGIIFALAGLLLFVYFIRKAGVRGVEAGIRRLGWGFLAVLVASSIRYFVRAYAWTLCFEPPYRVRFRDTFKAYVTGDAIGNVLPLGIVASEPTKAAFLSDRVPLLAAVSAVAVQNLFYGLSVAVFIFSGVAALLFAFALPDALRLTSFIALGVVVAVLFAGFMLVRMRVRFVSGALGALERRGIARRIFAKRRESVEAKAGAVEDTVYSFYSRHPGRCLAILFLEGCFHLAGALEVYVTLYFISDVPPTFLAAYILESVNRIINVVFKFVPLRAGVDEAGSGLLTEVLSFGEATGVTLAIIRKARIIFWTALGVAFLVWRGLPSRRSKVKNETVEEDREVVPAAARSRNTG